MSTNRTSKLVYLGLMVGIALALHIIESFSNTGADTRRQIRFVNIAALYDYPDGHKRIRLCDCFTHHSWCCTAQDCLRLLLLSFSAAW